MPGTLMGGVYGQKCERIYFTHFSATSRMQEKVSDMTNSFHHFLGPKEPKKIAVVDRLAHPCGNLLWGTQIGEVFSTIEVEVRDLNPTITSIIELVKCRFPDHPPQNQFARDYSEDMWGIIHPEVEETAGHSGGEQSPGEGRG
jgi:hypothetical protein